MTANAVTATSHIQLVTFPIGDDLYGINIYKVREVINVRPISDFDEPVAFARGYIKLRSKIIPVIDMKTRLDIVQEVPGDVEKKTRIVILDMAGKPPIGILVDDFSKVVSLNQSSLEPLLADTRENLDRVCVEHIGKTDTDMILIVSPELILSPGEERLLREKMTGIEKELVK